MLGNGVKRKRIGENLLKINAFSYELFLFRNIYFIERKVYFWHFERFKEEPSTQTQTYCQMFMGIQKRKRFLSLIRIHTFYATFLHVKNYSLVSSKLS